MRIPTCQLLLLIPATAEWIPVLSIREDRKKMIILDWLLLSVNYSLKTVLMFCIHAQMMFMTVLTERQ